MEAVVIINSLKLPFWLNAIVLREIHMVKESQNKPLLLVSNISTWMPQKLDKTTSLSQGEYDPEHCHTSFFCPGCFWVCDIAFSTAKSNSCFLWQCEIDFIDQDTTISQISCKLKTIIISIRCPAPWQRWQKVMNVEHTMWYGDYCMGSIRKSTRSSHLQPPKPTWPWTKIVYHHMNMC